MQRRARSVGSECMALMTADKRFAEILGRLISDNQPVGVLMPSRSVPAANFRFWSRAHLSFLCLWKLFIPVRAIPQMEVAWSWHELAMFFDPAAFSPLTFRSKGLPIFVFQNGLGELTGQDPRNGSLIGFSLRKLRLTNFSRP